MSKILGKGIYVKGEPSAPTASLTPQAGVTYTNGISGIEPSTLSLLSAAISNNADITSTTNTVYVDYKSIHVKIDVANQVTIALDGKNYAFDVLGFNHDALTDAAAYGAATATGKAGMTLQMHDLFVTNYSMNGSGTNSGGWKSSPMRTSTMVTMKGYMPTAWQSVIKKVDKKSGLGGGSSSGTETTSDDLFLLAEQEVFVSIQMSVSGEGTWYAYYRYQPVGSNIKDDSAWWLRSPFYKDSYTFCFVDDIGDINADDAELSNGVAFAFCI